MTKFNLPIKHNQLIVTRNFSSLRDEIIDLHDKDRGARLTLLLTEVGNKLYVLIPLPMHQMEHARILL